MISKVLFLTLFGFILISCSEADHYVCNSYEKNTDYNGYDLGFSRNIASVQACSNLCVAQQSKGCNGFTFWDMGPSDRICFLKKFTGTPTSKIQAQGRTSCVMKLVKDQVTQKPTDKVQDVTKPNQCFTEEKAFFGFSDSADIVSVSSLGECCNACKNQGKRCLAFSFLSDQAVCYIYLDSLSDKDKVYRDQATSGFVNPAYL